MKQHREFQADPSRGKRCFRDCKEGCPVMQQAVMFSAFDKMRASCAECRLRPGLSPEAQSIYLRWTLPDALLGLGDRPYWFIAGVSLLRRLNSSAGA